MALQEECRCPDIRPRESWIYTYGDMVTLLLAFFIIIFSDNNQDIDRFRAISAALRGGPPASPFIFSGGESFFESLKQELETSELLEETVLTVDDRGVTVSLNDSALFASGSSKLRNGAGDVVEKMANFLYLIPNSIVIEGHTDDKPLSGRGQSNWHLSSARASEVTKKFQELGIDIQRMEAVGYSSSRPKVSNESEQGRAINRRIDILIKPDDGPP